METKKCTGCGEEKLLIEFSKRAASKDGYQPMCKCCVGLYKKDYYEKNKNDISNKAKSRRKEHGDYIRATEKRRRDGNRETYRAMRKAYRKRNPDKIRAAKQRSYVRNREAILKKTNAYNKKYRKTNPDKINAKTARRRANKLQATPIWSNSKDIDDFYTAALMFRLYTGEQYHVDHVVPLNSDVVCGLHCEDNLQVMLATDNIAKGNRHWPDMW